MNPRLNDLPKHHLLKPDICYKPNIFIKFSRAGNLLTTDKSMNKLQSQGLVGWASSESVRE